MAWGSGRSGKSTASRAYTPSRDLKSGMPQETETPAPVRMMMLRLLLITSTQSCKVLRVSNFFLLGGSERRLNKSFHIVMLSRLSGISLPDGRRFSKMSFGFSPLLMAAWSRESFINSRHHFFLCHALCRKNVHVHGHHGLRHGHRL